MRSLPHMIPIEISIAKGIQRWLERPENSERLKDLIGRESKTPANYIAEDLYDEMQAYVWLGRDRLTDNHATFRKAVIRAWISYNHGRYLFDPEVKELANDH